MPHSDGYPPLTTRLTDVLRTLTLSQVLEPQAPVFGYWQMTKSFPRVVKRAGIAPIRFHDLRRTFASRLQQAGVPLEEVQALLGHRTLCSGADLYPPSCGISAADDRGVESGESADDCSDGWGNRVMTGLGTG